MGREVVHAIAEENPHSLVFPSIYEEIAVRSHELLYECAVQDIVHEILTTPPPPRHGLVAGLVHLNLDLRSGQQAGGKIVDKRMRKEGSDGTRMTFSIK